MAGIPDPLRQLPDLHAVLDVAEVLRTEALTRDELSDYYRQVYSTPVVAASTTTASAATPGFSVEEQKASFNAFRSFAGGVE